MRLIFPSFIDCCIIVFTILNHQIRKDRLAKLIFIAFLISLPIDYISNKYSNVLFIETLIFILILPILLNKLNKHFMGNIWKTISLIFEITIYNMIGIIIALIINLSNYNMDVLIFIYFIISRVILIIRVSSADRYKIALNKIQDLNIMTKLVRFLLGITILCFLTINYFYLDNFNITTSKKIIMILLLVSGVFIYLNIVIQQIMKYLNSLYEERLLKNYYKVSSDYLELIYSKTKQMKMISHNIKDHLIMIKYFAKTDNEKLIKYLESMDKLEDISDVILIPHMEFISPILQSKIEFASRKRIKIDVKNQIRGEVLEIWDKIDIILIVSNLLDNAIEAVSNCKDEHKYIEFTIGEKMNYIYFKSINYYNYPNDNLKNKLKAVSYNFNRGNGLKIIDVIVKKYDGWWDYKIKEENIIFIVTLSKGSNKILS